MLLRPSRHVQRTLQSWSRLVSYRCSIYQGRHAPVIGLARQRGPIVCAIQISNVPDALVEILYRDIQTVGLANNGKVCRGKELSGIARHLNDWRRVAYTAVSDPFLRRRVITSVSRLVLPVT